MGHWARECKNPPVKGQGNGTKSHSQASGAALVEHFIAAVGVCPSVLNRLRAKRDATKLDRFSEMESSADAEQHFLVSCPGYSLILAVEINH